MFILGAIAFTLIGLVILAVIMSEVSKETKRSSERRERLRVGIEDAMTRKDITALKRMRLMNASQLEAIDKGLGARIEVFIDELAIDADDAAKFGARKVGAK